MAYEVIGRREELVALAEFLDVVPVGGAAMLLEGDAGIGKTALWQEGVHLARERGLRVLAARSSHAELQVAFATIGDLFAPVLDETLPHLVPVQRRALEVAFLRRDSGGRPPDVRLLGAALLSVVRSLAREEPLLVALDDAQWIDASSASVLAFVLRRLQDDAVAVLATVRGRPVEAPFELERSFSELRRLTVEPLTVGAIYRMLWGRLALNLPRPQLVRVHAVSGGNPFFALELGRALARGAIRADIEGVLLPDSLREVVAERLRALPMRVRQTLVAVAALSAPSVKVLAPLSASAVEDIELARQRGVVELDGDRIRFAHPLLAPASYEAMPLHKRRRLHRRLADLDIDPEERARHLAIATTEPDEEIALALDSGAAHASARGAAQVAAELAERAVLLTPADATERVNRRRIAAAEYCSYAGDATKAVELLDAAVDAAESGALRAEALLQLAGLRVATDGLRVAANTLLRALAEPGLELQQEVDILCALAWGAAAGGDNQTGRAYAERALALAELLAEPSSRAEALATFTELTFWSTGHIRRDLLDRAIEIERASGADVGARMTLGRLLGRSDRFDEARAVWTELIAEATERADPQVGACIFFLARTEMAAGAWELAAELCDRTVEVARQTGREMVQPLSVMLLAELDAYRGNAEKARHEIPELLGIAAEGGYGGATDRLRRALAVLELSCGDAAASWQAVAPLFEVAGEMDEYLAQVAGSIAIEALIAIGDLDTAERLLGQVEELAAGADTALTQFAARCRGLLHAARGETARAIAALEAASEAPEPPQGVNPFERARTLLVLGTVQRRAQHKRAARESLERALALFEQLGARLWADRTRSELRRIGGRSASDSELSETERQIVALVVAGRRNREVAAELSLSPNTVAWNLSKVYRKLGVSSRTELVAHVAAAPPV
jgi:DNA-binding CsgD family transcriptional regulator